MPGLRTLPYTDLPAPCRNPGAERFASERLWSGAPQSDSRLPRTFPPAVPSDSHVFETQSLRAVPCKGKRRPWPTRLQIPLGPPLDGQGFPGFLARFHDAAGDPGKPQIDPESPHGMEIKWERESVTAWICPSS